MKVRDLAVETLSALDANRGRSALTILGIVIGISAVIAMTALIGGINNALVGELGLSQAQLVYINIWAPNHAIVYEDVDSIAQNVSEFEYVTGTAYGNSKVSAGAKSEDGSINGVKPNFFRAMAIKFLQGRAFTESEESKGAMVTILSKMSVKKLFESEDAEVVGKTVRIGNDEYTIVGVAESFGSSSYGNNIELAVPFSTLGARVTGNEEVSQIMGFVREGEDIEAVVAKTKDYVQGYLNIPDSEVDDTIYIYSMKSMIDSVNATMGAFSMLMTAVASISLLVGGIGIMNMMLTNVTERIREIGLRKALGARRSDITRQFILESVCLCLSGGLIGIVLGFAASFALTNLGASAFMGTDTTMEVRPVIDLGTVLLATGICVGIGVLFGWYPARRAARLDPVESLHYQ